MRHLISSLAVGVSLISLAALAMAAPPRLIGAPTTTDNGNTLTVAGSIADVKAQDVKIEVVATGTATVLCTSPGGAEPPKESSSGAVRVTARGEQTVLESELVNGVAAFSFATRAPTWSLAKEAGCPDGWTPEARDVTFESVTIRVSQKGNTLIKRTIRL